MTEARIIVTEECLTAIEAAAILPIDREKAEAWKQPDGRWSIKLQWNTIRELRSFQFEGETLSDCIIRLLATVPGKGLQ